MAGAGEPVLACSAEWAGRTRRSPPGEGGRKEGRLLLQRLRSRRNAQGQGLSAAAEQVARHFWPLGQRAWLGLVDATALPRLRESQQAKPGRCLSQKEGG